MQNNHKYVSQILIHVNKPNPFVLLTNTTGPTTSNHSTSKLPTSWGKPPTMNSEEQASYLCTSLSMQRTTQTNNYEILCLNYPEQAAGSKHWKANLLPICPSLCMQLHRRDCTLLSLKKTLSNQTSIAKKNEKYSFRVSDQKKSFRSFNQQFHRLACTLNPFNKHKLKTTNTSGINVEDHIMSQNNSWKHLQKTFLN
jgi:hypothetical protein